MSSHRSISDSSLTQRPANPSWVQLRTMTAHPIERGSAAPGNLPAHVDLPALAPPRVPGAGDPPIRRLPLQPRTRVRLLSPSYVSSRSAAQPRAEGESRKPAHLAIHIGRTSLGPAEIPEPEPTTRKKAPGLTVERATRSSGRSVRPTLAVTETASYHRPGVTSLAALVCHSAFTAAHPRSRSVVRSRPRIRGEPDLIDLHSACRPRNPRLVL